MEPTVIAAPHSAPATACVRVLAPAKLNFTLRVLHRRPDGYHELESWVVLIDLCDSLKLSAAAAGSGTRLTCSDPALPSDRRNLAVAAAEAMAAAAGRAPDVDVQLDKRIPVSAGLGGGSSDAAAVLRGLNELWGLHWPAERLAALGAGLGSDVPLFLAGPQSIIRGRGERVSAVASPWTGFVVLVCPPFGVSTADAYRAWAPVDRPTTPLGGTAGALPAAGLRPRLYNDLEPGVFRAAPRLAELHQRLDGLRDVPVRMSGSGSTLFALFDDGASAGAWAEAARSAAGEAVCVLVCETWSDRHLRLEGVVQLGDF
ncbi:MAG: 4-(cytidine 5'-diphospho)-2-C-methyl-D-erythritol kinase [Phycisphaerae bacterium]